MSLSAVIDFSMPSPTSEILLFRPLCADEAHNRSHCKKTHSIFRFFNDVGGSDAE
jgi:hypothetical protein